MIVAIDGPAGAGKSTAARTVATRLGYAYIDTGALYRTVGLAVLRAGKDTSNAEDVRGCLPKIDLGVAYIGGAQHVFLGKDDVSEDIRTPEASTASSNVAKVPEVRAFLLELQRDLARRNDSVLDGRDIGTVVLPEADVKVFLTASAEIRAQRRWLELQARGKDESYAKVLAEVIARDEQDMSRAAAPLRQAADATLLDSSSLTFEQTVQQIVEMIQQKKG
jgi:cytidylate kinase